MSQRENPLDLATSVADALQPLVARMRREERSSEPDIVPHGFQTWEQVQEQAANALMLSDELTRMLDRFTISAGIVVSRLIKENQNA